MMLVALLHRRLGLALAAVLCLAAAACAPGTGGDPGAAPGDVPEDDAEEADAADPDETDEADGELEGEITVWSWRTEDVEGYERIFDEFEAQHPGVSVEFVAHLNTEYNTILATSLTEPGGPDVMQLRAYGGLEEFVATGNVLPLDDEVPELDSFSEEMLDGARGTEDGRVYGVPFGIQTLQMFYNRDIFDEHGLEEPGTWDEFVSLLDTLSEAGVTPLATTGQDIWMLPIVHDTVAAARYGGEEFRQRLHAGETDFTDPDYVASIELLQELQPHFPDDVVGVAYTDAQVLFTTGQAAMFPGGSFETGFFKSQAPDLDLGVFRVPAPPGSPADTPLVPGWMDGSYGVNAQSDNQEAAIELVRWMATEEFGQMFSDELGQISAVPGVEPSDETLAEIVSMYEETPAPYLLLVDFRYGDPTGTDLLGEAGQEMLLGQSSPQDVAEHLQQGIEQWFEPEGT